MNQMNVTEFRSKLAVATAYLSQADGFLRKAWGEIPPGQWTPPEQTRSVVLSLVLARTVLDMVQHPLVAAINMVVPPPRY